MGVPVSLVYRHLENVNYDFSLFHVIFCHENNIINILLCVVKSFLFAQRNKNTVPNFVGVQKEIQQYITFQRKKFISIRINKKFLTNYGVLSSHC